MRLGVTLERVGRVTGSLAAVGVHDRLCCDVRGLQLRGRGLVAADVAGYLQVLPLLTARNILSGLLGEYDLRVRALEGSLAAGQVAELLGRVELLLGVVLVRTDVPGSLGVVCPFQLMAGRDVREVAAYRR